MGDIGELGRSLELSQYWLALHPVDDRREVCSVAQDTAGATNPRLTGTVGKDHFRGMGLVESGSAHILLLRGIRARSTRCGPCQVEDVWGPLPQIK